jgi:hypothetical protein
MTDSVLRKYATTTRSPESEADLTGDQDGQGAEDLGAFGWLRGVRDRSVMLELRKRNGNIVAVGYGWIERIEFDPSDGITLLALGQKIRIRGRNLNGEARPQIRLFHGLCRHRVPWIQESDQAGALRADKHATVIEAIEC